MAFWKILQLLIVLQFRRRLRAVRLAEVRIMAVVHSCRCPLLLTHLFAGWPDCHQLAA
jgi:hypothetical protein